MPILTRAKAQTAATCPCGFSRGEFQQPRRDHMILFFRGKVKKDFSPKKIHGNVIFSSNVLKRLPFKKIVPEHDFSCIIWKNGKKAFFPTREHDIFFFGRIMKDDLAQEIHGNMILFLYTYRCYKLDIKPPCQKNHRWSSPAKIHLKIIDILDWHSRKSSNNSLYFYGDLYRQFQMLLSCEKPRNLLYRIEVCLFFNLFGWRYITMNNLQYFV